MSDKLYQLNRRELLTHATAFSFLALSDAALSVQNGKTLSPIILGYYPDWTEMPPEKIDFTQFTHLCHAFAAFDRSGNLKFPDDSQTRRLIEKAHKHRVKVLLSLGGAGSNNSLRSQDPQALAESITVRVRQFDYDGVDVDWEGHENAAEGAKLSELTIAIRKRLPKSLVTMAAPGGDYFGRWFDTPPLLPVVDWLNIMTYDYCGPWSDKVLHNAPRQEVTGAVTYWQGRGWPADKLVLGIPSYGRRIRGKQFGDPAPKGTYDNNELSYNEIQKFLKLGWKPMRDESADVPYLVSPDGSELLSFEDSLSARWKGKYARTSGLKGFFFWEITEDFDGKQHVLVRAAQQGWQSKK